MNRLLYSILTLSREKKQDDTLDLGTGELKIAMLAKTRTKPKTTCDLSARALLNVRTALQIKVSSTLSCGEPDLQIYQATSENLNTTPVGCKGGSRYVDGFMVLWFYGFMVLWFYG